jgi:hypothetical protein
MLVILSIEKIVVDVVKFPTYNESIRRNNSRFGLFLRGKGRVKQPREKTS